MNEAISQRDGKIKLLTIIAVILGIALLGAIVWAVMKK